MGINNLHFILFYCNRNADCDNSNRSEIAPNDSSSPTVTFDEPAEVGNYFQTFDLPKYAAKAALNSVNFSHENNIETYNINLKTEEGCSVNTTILLNHDIPVSDTFATGSIGLKHASDFDNAEDSKMHGIDFESTGKRHQACTDFAEDIPVISKTESSSSLESFKSVASIYSGSSDSSYYSVKSGCPEPNSVSNLIDETSSSGGNERIKPPDDSSMPDNNISKSSSPSDADKSKTSNGKTSKTNLKSKRFKRPAPLPPTKDTVLEDNKDRKENQTGNRYVRYFHFLEYSLSLPH